MTVHFGLIDLVVLLAYLAVMVALGLRFASRKKNVESFLLGDRSLPWWAILGSIVATETSTATVLSVPGIGFGPAGMKFLQLALGYVVGRAIIVNTLLPQYFRGKLLTAYEVLDKRFGVTTKQAASLLFLVTRNLGDGLRLYLAAIVLHKLTEMPFVFSVIAMGVATILYTFFGGMKLVVWNDCLQFVIYMLGAIVAVFVIAAHVPGGWAEVWEYGQAHDKFQMFDFWPIFSEPFTFWAGLIGGAVLTIGTHGTDHMMVQRYLSARSEADAGRAIFASGFVVFCQFAVFLLIGIELACYYSHYPSIQFAKADEVFAHFMINVFPPNTGLVGLLLAAILAAALSTSLNSCAAVVVHDFYLTSRGTKPSEVNLYSLTRWLTVVFGFVQIAIGIWARSLTQTVVDNALAIAGFSAGLLLGMFALGVFTRRVGQVGALVGAAAGLIVLLCLQFGNLVLIQFDNLPVVPKIAYPWFALIGASTTFLVGWFVSLFVPRPGVAA